MAINARILEICLDGGLLKTQIMYKTNISHAMTTSYLSNLRLCGLLETSINESKQIFKTNEKGREYLYYYLRLQQLTEKQGNHEK
ncbi:MAG: winged helix-turn-helix domain-containing protein [Thermoproteota archaeon]